ncbi:MAG TPA: response regulator [Geobacteraceae bacterium]|nr:response regulator [Geobacteraceae bacterium]
MDKVMIIDDSKTAQAVLASILDAEYLLDIKDDAISALAVAESDLPDLFLLDIHMPGMDGFEACRILKHREITRDIPIIFITTLDSENEKVKGFEAGADDYVVKPVYPLELIARVRAQIGARKSRLHALSMERMSVFKEMAVTLCHEINNPLTSVNAYLHVLQRDFPELGDPVKDIVSAIQVETSRVSEIVSTLSEATTVASTIYQRDIRMFDLNRCTGKA